MLTLDTPIGNLAHVGPRHTTGLRRLGIKTIRDLLWHFPSRYEDFTAMVPIAEATAVDSIVSIHGTVQKIETSRAWRRRMTITTAYIADDSGAIRAVWFNQPYLETSFPEGAQISCSGKLKLDKRGLYLSNPSYEKITSHDLRHTGRLIPIYPETYGISSKYLRFLIHPLLPLFKNISHLSTIHFPDTAQEAEMARKHFAFEELLLLQLRAQIDRKKMQLLAAPSIAFDKNLIANFVKKLPFALTNDQRVAAFEILKDIERPYPMNRLLNGDVGSGKTIVALIAAYQAAQAGYQTVFMAPTEILANQHYETIKSLLSPPNPLLSVRGGASAGEIGIGLLTGSKKLNRDADIIIGTHAVIQKGVEFENLGLVVIDEQHRFGVAQRMKLIKNQKLVPHLLSMTATPIPRTLALTIYGDLDVSLIKEKPKGRQEIITRVVPHEKRQDAYGFIEKQIKEGRQVFVICPRIERASLASLASSASLALTEMKMVKEEHEKLSRDIFPHRRVAMLHGKMKPKEKDEIMRQFKDHDIDILVSTSVIEVGVDVPNATIMMIESAERFGLAQLHQFRGRVGRGAHQSYCFLFTSSPDIRSTRRLKALEATNDGFRLAEMDLKIRGPGEFTGTVQSGVPDLAMASLSDIDLIKQARDAAKELLAQDPTLSRHSLLKAQLERMQRVVHFE